MLMVMVMACTIKTFVYYYVVDKWLDKISFVFSLLASSVNGLIARCVGGSIVNTMNVQSFDLIENWCHVESKRKNAAINTLDQIIPLFSFILSFAAHVHVHAPYVLHLIPNPNGCLSVISLLSPLFSCISAHANIIFDWKSKLISYSFFIIRFVNFLFAGEKKSKMNWINKPKQSRRFLFL